MEEQLISKKNYLKNIDFLRSTVSVEAKNLILRNGLFASPHLQGKRRFSERGYFKTHFNDSKMKENLSLDEMREMLSPKMKDVSMTADDLIHKGLISRTALDVFSEGGENSVFFPRSAFAVCA